jgi:predicted nucleic acid-binding protein
MSEAVYAYYLDASALVKLVVDEPGTRDVREYFNTTPNACVTLVSFVEALGVLKRKWRCRWDEPDYHYAVECLLQMIYGGKPEVDNMALAEPSTFRSVSQIAEQHNIDFADALQLFAILKGKYAPLTSGSKTRFICADRGLVRAARSQEISTWCCSRDGALNWAPPQR